jgi:hypothetical protein
MCQYDWFPFLLIFKFTHTHLLFYVLTFSLVRSFLHHAKREKFAKNFPENFFLEKFSSRFFFPFYAPRIQNQNWRKILMIFPSRRRRCISLAARSYFIKYMHTRRGLIKTRRSHSEDEISKIFQSPALKNFRVKIHQHDRCRHERIFSSLVYARSFIHSHFWFIKIEHVLLQTLTLTIILLYTSRL